MNYIVLDFEFNQAFDFDENCPCDPFPECRFEIIQIGAVKLDDNFNETDSFNILIKPQIYTRIHPYVQKITGITDEMLESQYDFPAAAKKFYEFMGEDRMLCVWGKSDIRTLYRNLVYHRLIVPPVIIRYIDVQALATSYLKYSKGGAVGLKNAVELLEIPSNDDEFHNALYDAKYTAKVFNIVKKKKLPIKIFNSSHIITKNSIGHS
ncbi:MAG: exonuclease domain-containing protein [Firmicutes bacterium]|nr:exonuclease domain-containing protein [Bacillota bacterium]